MLAGQPDHVAAVRFLNYEGQPEAVDLVNRFEQVHAVVYTLHMMDEDAVQRSCFAAFGWSAQCR